MDITVKEGWIQIGHKSVSDHADIGEKLLTLDKVEKIKIHTRAKFISKAVNVAEILKRKSKEAWEG